MCSEPMTADYLLVHSNPQALFARDLRARFKRIDDALAQACAASLSAGQQSSAAPPGTKEAASGKPKKSPQRTATGSAARGKSAAKADPR